MPKPIALLVDATYGTTTYIAGQYFTTSGIVVSARYSGGVTQVVYNYTYLVASPLDVNTNNVIFSYTESGRTITANLPITVLPSLRPITIAISSSSIIRTTQYYYKEKHE